MPDSVAYLHLRCQDLPDDSRNASSKMRKRLIHRIIVVVDEVLARWSAPFPVPRLATGAAAVRFFGQPMSLQPIASPAIGADNDVVVGKLQRWPSNSANLWPATPRSLSTSCSLHGHRSDLPFPYLPPARQYHVDAPTVRTNPPPRARRAPAGRSPAHPRHSAAGRLE